MSVCVVQAGALGCRLEVRSCPVLLTSLVVWWVSKILVLRNPGTTLHVTLEEPGGSNAAGSLVRVKDEQGPLQERRCRRGTEPSQPKAQGHYQQVVEGTQETKGILPGQALPGQPVAGLGLCLGLARAGGGGGPGAARAAGPGGPAGGPGAGGRAGVIHY